MGVRVLGIDPGLLITGYGCVEDGRAGNRRGASPALVEAGLIRLGGSPASGKSGRRRVSIAERLAELDEDLRGMLGRLRPDAAAVESLFAHYAHPATAIAMAHARGVILLNMRRAGLPLVELKPNTVKKFIAGHGHAGKSQVQEAVRSALRLAAAPEPPDVADAIAIALCAAWRLRE